jgi:GNAT superfamily N-acetyltransferase
MSKQDRMEKPILNELGNGLILRKATPADGEVLSDFNARIHTSEKSKEPDERVRVWTHDLMKRPHPTFNVGDFTIVEDAEAGEIVSSMNLISQTWSYAGIDFKVGRPELVGTDPDYRGRGLIRSQFDVIHQWSEQRGELVQAITGIPNYYRMYGYEMGMELGGGRVGFKPQIPKLNQDKNEPYQLRPAEETDLPFLVDLYAHANERYLVSCVRDEELWRYELNGRSPNNVNRQEIRIIETEDIEAVGYLLHPHYRWGAMMPATGYEIRPGISWDAVTPTVIRYLYSTGEKYQTETGIEEDFEAFGFWLGSEHPVYDVILDRLPRVRDPYAWYLRVPNLPGFVRHIAPVLEARLAASPLVGHTGELKLTFYRSGLWLSFKSGRLVDIEEWKPTPHRHSGDAGFPELTFLQLLFGYRDLKELKFAFADCWTKSDQARRLLEVIFPKKPSQVWPVS